jgi:hypothetical protein
MQTAKVLLAMILVSSLMANVRWVNAASNTADYRLTKKVVLGGEGGWDYFEVDPTTSHVFIPRGDHILVVDSSGTQLTDIPNAHESHAIVFAPELKRAFLSADASVAVLDMDKTKTRMPYSTIPPSIECSRLMVAAPKTPPLSMSPRKRLRVASLWAANQKRHSLMEQGTST